MRRLIEIHCFKGAAAIEDRSMNATFLLNDIAAMM
jgi:hypothetical protein